jgi:LysR family transcriptional activator of nhaA
LRETGATRQAVRIGALATLSRNFQIGFLKPVLKRSDVEVILKSGSPIELLHSLQSLNLDVILTNCPPPTDTLTPFIAHRLSEQPVSLVGTTKLVGSTLSVPDLLAAHPVILPTMDSSVRIGFDAYVDRMEIRPQIAAEVDDIAMMRLLVREGFALAILPPIAVRDELESGLLMEVDTLPSITETFYAVTLDRRFPNPLVRSLIAEAKSGR